ncbi:hypothetical protein SDRG_02823 [Saprolegnia diclina VS20]|uniref:Uncharacterized protein n=1 Tax=Saprolegnia diclina (strain VS20) TaxID=1156394 RepID=T0QPX2_SAPDV|nr:hypothetical protein SDRG_02823 [Saprolegnia diclina VS20]EQC40174.1 hypothetical protein SDRG_02823 [Saprolegnia diclina VS20]|eukprot:XP_008606648.1 hypothetical protein SDRG_02823 [Saprolegnia diclina VS20]
MVFFTWYFVNRKAEPPMNSGKTPHFRLQPRIRRRTPLLDVAIAVVLGGVSGVYIFNDTLRKVGMPPGIETPAPAADAPAATSSPAPEA